jgi:hypothetical protein
MQYLKQGFFIGELKRDAQTIGFGLVVYSISGAVSIRIAVTVQEVVALPFPVLHFSDAFHTVLTTFIVVNTVFLALSLLLFSFSDIIFFALITFAFVLPRSLFAAFFVLLAVTRSNLTARKQFW